MRWRSSSAVNSPSTETETGAPVRFENSRACRWTAGRWTLVRQALFKEAPPVGAVEALHFGTAPAARGQPGHGVVFQREDVRLPLSSQFGDFAERAVQCRRLGAFMRTLSREGETDLAGLALAVRQLRELAE